MADRYRCSPCRWVSRWGSAATDQEEYTIKVALLGATGFVGSALLKEALDRGHMVTPIVPHP